MFQGLQITSVLKTLQGKWKSRKEMFTFCTDSSFSYQTVIRALPQGHKELGWGSVCKIPLRSASVTEWFCLFVSYKQTSEDNSFCALHCMPLTHAQMSFFGVPVSSLCLQSHPAIIWTLSSSLWLSRLTRHAVCYFPSRSLGYFPSPHFLCHQSQSNLKKYFTL